MNNFKHTILLSLILLSTSPSFARNFYEMDSTMSVTYTSIDTGTKPVITDLAYKIRFSDDKQFCRAYIAGAQFECSVKDIYSKSWVSTWMQKETWVAVFNRLAATNTLPSYHNEKLQRILSPCTDCNFSISGSNRLSYQIDDSLPEAFHLFIFGMTVPKPMSVGGRARR